MLNLREWNNCEHPDDWKGLWGTLRRVMFLVYVYCLERHAKTAKSPLLPGRLPEIGAVFFWPSSHVIYPWESYFPLRTPPLGAAITAGWLLGLRRFIYLAEHLDKNRPQQVRMRQ